MKLFCIGLIFHTKLNITYFPSLKCTFFSREASKTTSLRATLQELTNKWAMLQELTNKWAMLQEILVSPLQIWGCSI